VIRIISPHLKDKKTDPAVLVIDDRANFVISVLSGHLGGANELTKQIAQILQSVPVITTAADVNYTISVDLIGREFGWVIENPENITRISAMMVNEETIGLYQDAGENNWLKLSKIPENVIKTNNLETLEDERYRGGLIITDKKIDNKKIIEKSVVYRPKNLVVGIGLHWDTSMETIESGIKAVFENFGLDIKCIRNIASIDKEKRIKGLQQLSEKSSIPIETFEKKELLHILVPNPSDIVKKYEGTASVSEAASLISSSGNLIVPKQKFPPNLTVAVAKVNYQ
jgi:cobalt-precorrin 5A hydrolase